MADKDTGYLALVGLDFEGLKPPVRVEAGGPIPKKVSPAEIQQLLADGLIREAKAETPKESEGE